ncbi:hypothetical protein [Rhizobium sp. YTU87027]|uniref:hypothetical protein n=1 Tax=Rhizobium sp. YTU87027 TaxID=3417741 RepID=UPI003D69B263
MMLVFYPFGTAIAACSFQRRASAGALSATYDVCGTSLLATVRRVWASNIALRSLPVAFAAHLIVSEIAFAVI